MSTGVPVRPWAGRTRKLTTEFITLGTSGKVHYRACLWPAHDACAVLYCPTRRFALELTSGNLP